MNESFDRLVLEVFDNTAGFEAIENSEYMSEQQKEVILRRYRDGMDISEIAKSLELSRQRIHQILADAMEGVRMTLVALCMTDKARKKYDTRVTEFDGLSYRCVNALMRNNLTTPSQVVKYVRRCKEVPAEEAIMRLRGLGRKTAVEICTFMRTSHLMV